MEAPTQVTFAGYRWATKHSLHKVGPGPNLFLDRNVRVDARGLHLQIQQDSTGWSCAEVIAQGSFGYGTYEWTVAGDLTRLHPQSVLGLFTWSDDPAQAHSEVDIEFSRWGRPSLYNGRFTVQQASQSHDIALAPAARSRHVLEWHPDLVAFSSIAGHTCSWVYEGTDVPRPGPGVAPRMNLWLFGGRPGAPQEVTITSFRYVRPNHG